MSDLHWTLPVARWATAPAAMKSAAGLEFIDPMLRRRLSNLSRMALAAAAACLGDHIASDRPAGDRPSGEEDKGEVRVIFASRHGELRRSTDILRTISAGQPVSPTAFSLSVMNAMTGIFSIARRDRSASSALSAGPETLGYALLEGYAQYVSDPTSPVLVVYADEIADPVLGDIEDEIEAVAVAVLIAHEAQTHLSCRMVQTPSESAEQADVLATSSDIALSATQSAAVCRALAGQGDAAWRGAARCWHWSGSDA